MSPGPQRELGLGCVALVSLAEAREQASANRKLARAGGHPLAEKRRSRLRPFHGCVRRENISEA